MDIKKKVTAELSELFLGVPSKFRVVLGNKSLDFEGGTSDFMVKANVIFESGYTFYKHSSSPNKNERTGGIFFKKLKKDTKATGVASTPYTGKFITSLLADEKIISLNITTQSQGGVIVTEIVSNMNQMAVASPLKKFYFIVREYADYAEVDYLNGGNQVVHTMTLKKGVRVASEMKKFIA